MSFPKPRNIGTQPQPVSDILRLRYLCRNSYKPLAAVGSYNNMNMVHNPNAFLTIPPQSVLALPLLPHNPPTHDHDSPPTHMLDTIDTLFATLPSITPIPLPRMLPYSAVLFPAILPIAFLLSVAQTLPYLPPTLLPLVPSLFRHPYIAGMLLHPPHTPIAPLPHPSRRRSPSAYTLALQSIPPFPLLPPCSFY